jgi:type VI secretion system protein ImpH
LTSLLEDYFSVPVAVQQFVGQWLQIPTTDRACLGRRKTVPTLGESAIVGRRAWSPMAKFRLRLGPLSYDTYCQFLPFGNALCPLIHLTRLFVGYDRPFDVQLVLSRDRVPLCRLGEKGPNAPRLGWSTWLTSRIRHHDPDDVILPDRWVMVRRSEQVPNNLLSTQSSGEPRCFQRA